jgi:hypothetical protein
MPNPPALHTAATSSGVVTQFIPASIMGCLQPNNSVKGVLIIEFSFVITEFQAAPGDTYQEIRSFELIWFVRQPAGMLLYINVL